MTRILTIQTPFGWILRIVPLAICRGRLLRCGEEVRTPQAASPVMLLCAVVGIVAAEIEAISVCGWICQANCRAGEAQPVAPADSPAAASRRQVCG